MSKNSMRRATNAGLILIALALITSWPARAQTSNVPPRTFPQFVGTWILDEGASTGEPAMTPFIALTMTIATTPETISLTKRLRVGPLYRGSASPPPEVYRFDGTETPVIDARTGAILSRSHRFALVADMLALTIKEWRVSPSEFFTLVTDAYAVEGDVLTVHRQLSAVSAPGQISTMGNPKHNFRHTYIYRRSQP
jgi:hypothetical protein